MEDKIGVITKAKESCYFVPSEDYKKVKGGVEILHAHTYFHARDIHIFPEEASFYVGKPIGYEEDYRHANTKEVSITLKHNGNNAPVIEVLVDRYGENRRYCELPWDMFNKIMSKIFSRSSSQIVDFFKKINEEIDFDDSYRG